MPKASTKAMSAESILETAIDIPDDIGAEVIKLLSGGRVTAKADLAVIDAFVKAAIAVTKLPSYEVMIEEDEVEKHCVRCHGVFSDMTNDSDACVIPHVFSSDDYYRGGPNCGIVYSSICCRSGVTVEGDKTGGGGFYHVDRLGSCYKGFHTTNPKNVERQYNEINIFPCAMKGGACLRWDLYNEDKGEPVFGDYVSSQAVFLGIDD